MFIRKCLFNAMGLLSVFAPHSHFTVEAQNLPGCYIPSPTVLLSEAELDYGSVEAGTSKTLTIDVTYSKRSVWSTSATECGCSAPNSVIIDLRRDGSSRFDILDSTRFTLSASQTKTIRVRFNAPSGTTDSFAGTFIASIDRDSVSGCSHYSWVRADDEALLSAVGYVPQPNIHLDDLSMDFGDVLMGETASKNLSIENVGTATLNGTLAIMAPFSVSPTSFSVSPGSSRVVTITMTPAFRGTFTRNLLIESNDPDAAELDVNVRGRVVAPYLFASPSPLTFGSVPAGDTKYLNITVTNVPNSNAGDMVISNLTMSNNNFIVVDPGDNELEPGDSTDMQIAFSPVTEGNRTAILSFNTNDPDNLLAQISVSGYGTAPVIDPSTLNLSWGDTHLGTTESRTLTLQNVGSQTLSITSFGLPNAFLNVSPSSATLVPGASQNFTIDFHPTGETELQGSIVVNNNDPLTPSLAIAVEGRGVTPELLAADTLYFGSVLIDPNNPSQADTLELALPVQNNGEETLTITSINSNHPAFTPVTSTLNVAPHAEATLSVRYRPTSIGTHSATLVLGSNDYYNPTHNVSLQGTGVSNLDLSLASLEWTQSLQNPFNSYQVVAQKNTIVRAYIDVSLWGVETDGNEVKQVDAVMHVYRDGIELLGSPLKSLNGPIHAVHGVGRTSTDAALNFLIPASWTACQLCSDPNALEVEVELNPEFGSRVTQHLESDFDNNSLTEEIRFYKRYEPSIAAIPISYGRAAGYCQGLPDMNHLVDGVVFFRKIFPIGGFTYQIQPPISFDCDINGLCDDGVQSSLKLFESLFIAGHLGGDSPDLIYGWFRCNPYYSNGRAQINGKVAFGNTQETRYQRTYAHEVGHNLGLRHRLVTLASSEENKDDPFYDQVGFDPFDFEVMYESPNPVTADGLLADIMYSGLLTNQAWVEEGTYSHLFNELRPGSPFTDRQTNIFFSDQDDDVWLISGMISDDGAAVINPIYETRGPWGMPDGDESSPYWIELVRADGAVLLQVPVDARVEEDFIAAPESGQHAFFTILPVDEEAAELRLYSGVTLLASVLRSTSEPSLVIERPLAGEIIGEALLADWTATDADGDELVYTVQYRHSPSVEFKTLAVNLTDTHFEYPSSLLPGGSEAQVRILVSDGFHTVYQDSGALTVSNKAPDVFIISPEAGSTVLVDSPISFEAVAIDAEEGILTEGALQWSSDIDGHLGEGAVLVASLSEGMHQISVTAKDSQGEQATAQQELLVVDASRAPRAVAGPDQEVDEGTWVLLDATQSYDPDEGDDLSFAWLQLAGPPVDLSDTFVPDPQFVAPQVDADTRLSFQVTVSDSLGKLATDSVEVTVINTEFPVLDLGTTIIDFGVVALGETANRSLTVRNTGLETLSITGMESSRSVFAASPSQVTLQPGETSSINISFSPDEEASYEVSLTVQSNTVAGVPTVVVLRGETTNPATHYDDYGPGGSIPILTIVDGDGGGANNGGGAGDGSAGTEPSPGLTPVPTLPSPEAESGEVPEAPALPAAGCSLIDKY